MSDNAPPPSNSEIEQPVTGDRGAEESDQFFQFLRRRTQELQTTGMAEERAHGTAMLEHRITRWPPAWGNELNIIIYGDFRAPDVDLHFDDLGIIVEGGAVKDSLVRSAMCVLKARVTVPAKNVEGLVDAVARINTLLGVFAAVNWGNPGCGWWCHVTHGSIGGVMSTLDSGEIEKAIKSLQMLRPDIRGKISSALHWIREPRQMLMEGYRNDTLRIYAGYWNAFECLVEAACILRPQPKVSKKEKQDKIDKFLADHGGKLDTTSIGECYRKFVDAGFVGKASHALRQCFPERADKYILECFKIKPEKDRLYNIRNAINHGDIDANNPQELIRIEDKQRRLWMIVFGMLGRIIAVPCPLDPEAN